MPAPAARRRQHLVRSSRAHRAGLQALQGTGTPFLVGGAYALEHYTEIVRGTKDLDGHVRPGDSERLLSGLSALGFRVEWTSSHWLAKAFRGRDFIDIIFNSGNGICPVDEAWFEFAEPGQVLGMPVRLCPVEEMIWSKSFVQERERYDGADIAHLLRARGRGLAWRRLLDRFGPHWRVPLGHLVLFGFVYPGDRDRIPRWVMRELLRRLAREVEDRRRPTRLCQGTLLSRAQYLVDVTRWGYRDARCRPVGPLSPDAVRDWTRAYRAPVADDGD
jgi:hypothetical protein